MLLAFFVAYFHTWEHHYSGVMLAATALLLPGAGAVTGPRQRVLLLLIALVALPTPYAMLSPGPSWSLGAWLAMSLIPWCACMGAT